MEHQFFCLNADSQVPPIPKSKSSFLNIVFSTMMKHSLVTLVLLTLLSLSQSYRLHTQCFNCLRYNTKCPHSCCIPKWGPCSWKLRCCGGWKCKKTYLGPRCAPPVSAQPLCAREWKYCSTSRKCCDGLECKYVKVGRKFQTSRCVPEPVEPSATPEQTFEDAQDPQDCVTCVSQGTVCPPGC